MKRIFLGAGLAAIAALTWAAGSDELWEITTQMDMPGIPAGMGTRTTQVCSEKGDPKSALTRSPDMEKCKLSDYRESGNRITMTVSCPEGTGTVDNTYNAARSEYKGTMTMRSREGTMTVQMAGRRVGDCDAQQARAEREATAAVATRQHAQGQAMLTQFEQTQIKECTAAVDTMQMQRLGMYARCESSPSYCDSMVKSEATRNVAKACMAKAREFCERYQTMDGFLKANASDEAAAMCKLSRQQVAASHCPRALQSENLTYLGRFCPAEARPLAQQHCAGRRFTAAEGGKYAEFCTAYLAQASLEPQAAEPASPKPAPELRSLDEQVQDKVKQGVKQGLDRLKGLFGR